MKHKTLLLGMAAVVLALGFSGCGKEALKASDVAVTPQPSAVPTVAATATPTPTPAPTATPAPRLIGVKTDTAKKVLLTNNTNKEIREFYLKASDDEDWGKNLVPAESSIKVSEQVQMYYTPVSGGSAENSSDGTEKTAKSVFDIRLADGDGNTWEIYGAELSDMEKATIRIQEEDAYLTYMSISEKKQKDTRNKTASDDSDYDSEDYDYENDDEMNDTDQSDNSNYDYQNQDQQTNDNQNTGTDQTTDNSGNTNNTDNSGNTDNTDTVDNGQNTDNSDNTGGSENDFSYEDSGNDVDYGDDIGDTGDTGAGDDEFVWDESGEWG